MLSCFSNSIRKVYVGCKLFFWAVCHFFHSSLLVFTLCSLFYDPGLSILFSIENTSGFLKSRWKPDVTLFECISNLSHLLLTREVSLKLLKYKIINIWRYYLILSSYFWIWILKRPKIWGRILESCCHLLLLFSSFWTLLLLGDVSLKENCICENSRYDIGVATEEMLFAFYGKNKTLNNYLQFFPIRRPFSS